MTLTNIVDDLVLQAKYIGTIDSAILLFNPQIYQRTLPHLICRSVGQVCQQGCNQFNPATTCSYADLSLEYQTFAQVFWQYRVEASRRNSKWKLFYDCFHPPQEEGEKVEKFTAEFPNDAPLLNNQQAASNYDTCKSLDPNDPAHWSKDRLAAATSGNVWERRMAATDWDWSWLDKSRKRGVKINQSDAHNKNKLDKILFNEFGEKYEDSGSYSIKKTHPSFLVLQGLLRSLDSQISIKVNFID